MVKTGLLTFPVLCQFEGAERTGVSEMTLL